MSLLDELLDEDGVGDTQVLRAPVLPPFSEKVFGVGGFGGSVPTEPKDMEP